MCVSWRTYSAERQERRKILKFRVRYFIVKFKFTIFTILKLRTLSRSVLCLFKQLRIYFRWLNCCVNRSQTIKFWFIYNRTHSNSYIDLNVAPPVPSVRSNIMVNNITIIIIVILLRSLASRQSLYSSPCDSRCLWIFCRGSYPFCLSIKNVKIG